MRARSVGLAASLALVTIASALGCTGAEKEPEEPVSEGEGEENIPPPPYDSLDARPCPTDSALTWENFGEAFMISWCTSCHSSQLDVEHRAGAPLSINFDDLDGVRAQVERVWIRAADQNNTMPPAGFPPDLERAQLGEWLACGAKTRDE